MGEDGDDVLMLLLLYRRRLKRRRNRRFWIHPIVSLRNTNGFFSMLWPQLKEDEEKFFNFTRMSKSSFCELLLCTRNELTKENTIMRDSIPAEHKLVIALRYLASGCSFVDLHYAFRIGISTARTIVIDVTRAVWKCMAASEIPPFTEERWMEIASTFEKFANFPHCISALDGKHIRMIQPANSGSMFYNYKGYFSIVLLAMCDANYRFTFVDVGSFGKSSDSGIFKNSILYNKLKNGELSIPDPSSKHVSSVQYPYVIVADDAFALSENVLKPYGGYSLDKSKKVFNYRLSRARRYIECSFGILASKWRIFQKPLAVNIELAEDIVKCACILHNFVRLRDGKRDDLNNIPPCPLEGMETDKTSRGNRRGLTSRDKFANYFLNVSPLPWQEEYIH